MVAYVFCSHHATLKTNGLYFPTGLRDDKHACALFCYQLRRGYWKQHLTFCTDCIFKQNNFYEEYEKVMNNSNEMTRRRKLIRRCKVAQQVFFIFVVPCIMLYSGEISPTRCNNCVFYSQWLYSTCFG